MPAKLRSSLSLRETFFLQVPGVSLDEPHHLRLVPVLEGVLVLRVVEHALCFSVLEHAHADQGQPFLIVEKLFGDLLGRDVEGLCRDRDEPESGDIVVLEALLLVEETVEGF
jgi:hypothetical protein